MKDLTWLKQSLIAHRGLYEANGSIPENSIAAFKRAIDNGFAIECDLNRTKDGQLIVFHDHHLKRLTSLHRFTNEVTYEDIKNLHLLHTTQTIPTFSELLTLVKGQVPLLIELKPFGDVKKMCETFMQHMASYQGQWAVFSFHPGIVLWFKKHYPDVIRGQISAYFDDNNHLNKPMKFLMKRLFFNRFTKPDFISYYIHNLPNKHVDKQKKKGITIISYAAKNQKELNFVRSLYDNVVFEHFIPKENA